MSWLDDCRKSHPALLDPLVLPKRYAEATLADVKHTTLRKCVLNYGRQFLEVAPQGFGPLFVGAAGQYKTFAAAALARELYRCVLINVGWVNCAAEFAKLERDAFDPATRARLEYLKTVPFLVMDDFSQVSSGGRMMQWLVEVGVTRYDNLLPTLWTGNLVLTKKYDPVLAAAVGPALGRRMFDASEGFRVILK